MLIVDGIRYRGVVFDLDGTLLTPQHDLPPVAPSICNDLALADVWVTLASARPPRSVASFASELGLRHECVALNGALAIDVESRVVAEWSITHSIAQEILSICGNHSSAVEASVYSDWRWKAASMGEGIAAEAKIIGFEPEHVDPAELTATPIHKILLIADQQILSELQGVLADFDVELACSKPHYLEITAHSASKQSAVSLIAQRAGLGLNDLIVFGDADNDVPLLRAAGLGVAVDNASIAAKAAADRVIGSHDSGAVVSFLHDALLDVSSI